MKSSSQRTAIAALALCALGGVTWFAVQRNPTGAQIDACRVVLARETDERVALWRARTRREGASRNGAAGAVARGLRAALRDTGLSRRHDALRRRPPCGAIRSARVRVSRRVLPDAVAQAAALHRVVGSAERAREDVGTDDS